MNEFGTYHPAVNFVYFVLTIVFSVLFMHPVCLFISLLCAISYSAMLGGRKNIKLSLCYMLPMMLVMALVNPLFNHAGATVITYLPGGNPLTLESVIYGFFAAMMISCAICWFSCYNAVMTSDKFIYLFGKIIPSMSLIFSMTLQFVPRFVSQLKVIANAQKCIGRDPSEGSIIKRAKNGLSILSIMVTWALENSVGTADSMKSRGYGLSGRTAFSVYKFCKRDLCTLGVIAGLGVYIFIGSINGAISFEYFPHITAAELSPYRLSVYVAYTALCALPIIVEVCEVRRWKAIKLKI